MAVEHAPFRLGAKLRDLGVAPLVGILEKRDGVIGAAERGVNASELNARDVAAEFR